MLTLYLLTVGKVFFFLLDVGVPLRPLLSALTHLGHLKQPPIIPEDVN